MYDVTSFVYAEYFPLNKFNVLLGRVNYNSKTSNSTSQSALLAKEEKKTFSYILELFILPTQ